ncbi:hypothetical protein BC567DRAFT_93790 [Phyllosticta citribraziliensis]
MNDMKKLLGWVGCRWATVLLLMCYVHRRRTCRYLFSNTRLFLICKFSFLHAPFSTACLHSESECRVSHPSMHPITPLQLTTAPRRLRPPHPIHPSTRAPSSSPPAQQESRPAGRTRLSVNQSVRPSVRQPTQPASQPSSPPGNTPTRRQIKEASEEASGRRLLACLLTGPLARAAAIRLPTSDGASAGGAATRRGIFCRRCCFFWSHTIHALDACARRYARHSHVAETCMDGWMDGRAADGRQPTVPA